MNIINVKGICVFMCFILLVLIAVVTRLNMLPILFGVLILSIFLILALVNNKFLLASTIYVFIIDAGNGLFVYNDHHLPIRELLFLILLIKLAYNICIKGFKDRDKKAVMVISILVPLYGIVVAFLRNNNLSYVFDDGKSYFFFIIGLCIYSLIYYSPNLKQSVIKHFMMASLLAAIVSIMIFVVSCFIPAVLYNMGAWLGQHNLGFAGIEVNGLPRVFLRAEIYVMTSFFFALGNLIATGKKSFYNSLTLKAIYLFSLVISNTRGIWIATILGILIFWASSNFTFKKILVTFIIIILIFLAPNMFPNVSTKIMSRLTSSIDFTDNQSNAIRDDQSFYLMEEFKNHPVLGKGFGATLSSGFTRSKETPYSFEMSYLELLYKLGIIGFGIFIIGLVWIANTIFKSDPEHRKILLISFVCFLIVSITNPYIVSSLGMFLISVLYAVAKDPKVITL